MAIEITPISHPDIPSAIHCIQAAFDADPYNNWVFDKTSPGAFNADRNFASLKAKLEWGIRNALFYVAKDPASSADRVLGVSMWLKPRDVGAAQSWREWRDDYVLWVKQGLNLLWYRGRGGLRTKRYYIWKREQAAAQAVLWTDPKGYYFCNIITVLPDRQGKGVGRKLFEVVMDQADREGRRCYLESSRDEPNVKIYEKMGFELRRKMLCKDDADESDEGCDLFCMVREPKGGTRP